MKVVVTLNAPDKTYIGYRDTDTSQQVVVTDAEVDELARDQQEAAWDEGQDVLEQRAENVGDTGFQRRPFEGFTPPSTQAIREALAFELATRKLDLEYPQEDPEA